MTISNMSFTPIFYQMKWGKVANEAHEKDIDDNEREWYNISISSLLYEISNAGKR